jgi:ABC-type nitrate/sulfonate/bicarbonate transport system substrate-binding protein
LGDDSPANLRAFGFLATRKRLAETQPAAVDAALKALIEATDWMDSNADEAAAIVAAKARAPLENVRRLIPSQHFTMSLKPVHLTGLQNIATFAAELGLTKAVVDAKQHIDASFLRRVAPARITMVL